jgi:hypothetical protein
LTASATPIASFTGIWASAGDNANAVDNMIIIRNITLSP